MSLNVFITAVCPAPSCGHDFKITPRGDGLDHGRTFDGGCANCGRTETFFIFDATSFTSRNSAGGVIPALL